MKIKITKPGLFGAEGEIPVGTTMTVKKEPLAWAGKYEVVSGDTEGAELTVAEDENDGNEDGGKTKTEDKKPAPPKPPKPPKNKKKQGPDLRRVQLEEALEAVSKEDHTDDGKPSVDAVNKLLAEGVDPITAEERDTIWAELQED